MIEHVSRNASLTTTLRASAASTATGQSAAVVMPDAPNAYVFILDVTAAATEVDDTLDVTIQTMVDGTNWIDVVHFTQVLGNGSAKRYIAKISAESAMTMFENATALSAGAIRNILGNTWRVSWVQVDAGGSADSFTFSVVGIPM